jgi:glycosyltransferase involved in cell wall biosynthesis
MSSSSPAVSIIIPAYNAARWIADTLQSALAQTWKNKEIILIDDGSTDDTVAIAERHECTVLKIIRQDNQGPGVARNKAFQESQGDYIQYLDHDDLLSPEKVEAQLKVLMESPPRMVGVSSAVYFMDGQDPHDAKRQDGWPMVSTDDPVNWLIDLFGPDGPFSMVPPGCWLTPRVLVEEAGAWDERPTPDDDGEFFTRVIVRSSGIRRAETGTFYFRKHPDGQNRGCMRTEELHWGALRSTERKAQVILAESETPRAKRALANLFMVRAVASYPFYPEITSVAIKRAEELGGASYFPPFGTWRGDLLSRLVGWKLARKASVLYDQHIRAAWSN